MSRGSRFNEPLAQKVSQFYDYTNTGFSLYRSEHALVCLPVCMSVGSIIIGIFLNVFQYLEFNIGLMYAEINQHQYQ